MFIMIYLFLIMNVRLLILYSSGQIFYPDLLSFLVFLPIDRQSFGLVRILNLNLTFSNSFFILMTHEGGLPGIPTQL